MMRAGRSAIRQQRCGQPRLVEEAQAAGRGVLEAHTCRFARRLAMFKMTAMERSVLAELSDRGGRGRLSGQKDRRPLERLVNKRLIERHILNLSDEEYVLTLAGKQALRDDA
jgi:hypothetical protein